MTASISQERVSGPLVHLLHTQDDALMSANRLTIVCLLAATGTAAADCPTRTQDLPATGFIASATRVVMENEVGPQLTTAPQSSATAQIGAAGGMRADSDAVLGTASIAGEITGHVKGLSGCASADLVDVREGATHLTASGSVPLFFTGLSLGFSLDRQVQLPLAARGDYLRAPLDRFASQFSIAFFDIEMTDERQNHLRAMIVPFSVEQSFAQQATDSEGLDRHRTTIETSMFRFVADDVHGSGELELFAFRSDWIDPPDSTMQPDPAPDASAATGFVRLSPLAISRETGPWRYELDAGWLDLAGPVDCKTERCGRGFYLGALRHAWSSLSIEGRAERTAFLTPEDQPAVEDRLTATVSVEETSRHISTSAFVARAAAWSGADVVHRGGLRTTVAQELSHGFSGVLDGELARAGASTMDLPANDARLLLSLAWQKKTSR